MNRTIYITEAQCRAIVKRHLLSEGNYSMNEIGEIACTLNDDGSYYVELFDAVTYHNCGHDTMSLEKIEDNFGSQIANEVESECADGKEHHYELALYDNETVDLNNGEELSNAAIKRLQHGGYYKNCRGFILPNGVVVYTDVEHNMCTKIPGIKGTFHFIELGCIRVLDHSIDLACEPTYKQWCTLVQVFDSYYGERLDLDLMNKQIGTASRTYYELDPDDIQADIRSYFSTGKIRGYESIYEGVDEMNLYHGTSANFDHFDLAYVLSGWGQMDWGYGIYLSDRFETAKEYSGGHMVYTAEVPDGKFLDSEYINAAEAKKLAKEFYEYYTKKDEYGKEAYAGVEREFWDNECKYIGESENGVQVYNTISSIMGDDKRASEYLYSKGYLGLRIESDFAASGEKFHNYVIFNPDDIKIIKKENL